MYFVNRRALRANSGPKQPNQALWLSKSLLKISQWNSSGVAVEQRLRPITHAEDPN